MKHLRSFYKYMKLTSKSIYLTFIFFIFSLMLFTNQSFANDNKSFQLKPGDIIITKGPVLINH